MDNKALQQWQQWLQQRRFRGFMHICGSQAWALEQALAVVATLGIDKPVIIGESHGASLDINSIKKLLGQQSSTVIFNAYQGFHANAFAIAAGTIASGGLMILISPELEQWPAFDDPDYRRFVANDGEIAAHPGNFLTWLSLCFGKYGQWRHQEQGGGIVADIQALELQYPKTDRDDIYYEQAIAIEKIKKVCTGHAKRPLLLLAARGRGKSASLGIAAADLLAERRREIIICAHALDALASFYQHFFAQLEQHGNIVSDKTAYAFTLTNGSRLRFFAIDELLRQRPACDLLLVDEAAAIPQSLLNQLLQHYTRMVFSSTSHGYEGSGQGLLQRFCKRLDQVMPQWQRYDMQQAIRYANNDPLEALLDHLFLLPKTLTSQAQVLLTEQPLEFFSISQKELCQQENLLTAIFSLLMTAHYQTSPDDLRVLLDQPQCHIFYVLQNKQLLGVALVNSEGGFTEQQCTVLEQQSRRFRGHILPQQLWLQGFSEALALRYARVMRIAVAPLSRRHGVGEGLIRHIERTLDVDILGSSFASDSDVLAFWQHSLWQCVQLGSKKDAASGAYAVVYLRAKTLEGEKLLAQSRQKFAANLAYLLGGLNNDIDADCVALLSHGIQVELLPGDRQQLLQYIQSRNSFEQVLPALARYLLQQLAQAPALTDKMQLARNCSISCILLQQGFAAASAHYGLAGRKALEAQIRLFLQSATQGDI